MLLHVTLLPIPQIYPAEVMEQVLPNYILENWKKIREKATDTVLERGVLIPHPKEDYDLLEERLLESLDLKIPRILKCGHFRLDPEEEKDVSGSDSEDFDDGDNDADICDDCGRRVRDGKYGSGTGSRRWDISVYAANGLMRAGAWGAAWREMERVDVEIIPWMDEELKRELASRTEEECKHAASLQEEASIQGPQGPTMNEERMREIYGEVLGDQKKEQAPSAQARQSDYGQQAEIPLQDLLKDYLLAAAQDRKNITIFILSIFVLYMAMMASRSTPTAPLAVHQPAVPSLSSSIPTLGATSSVSASIAPNPEPSIVGPTTTATASSAPVGTIETSASAQVLNEDPTDSIEARFEFAGE